MRKFLNISITLFAIAALILVFLDNKKNLLHPDTVVTEVKNDRLYIGKEPLYMRGINLDTVKPNYLSGDYAASKEDYRRWFNDIQAMHCNTIKVKTIMPAHFYAALLEHNQSAKSPLFLVQGVNIASDDIDVKGDQQATGTSKDVAQRVKDTVDIVHGNKTPIFSKNIKERYTSDVSDYTVAYSIDSALDYSDVIFSEIMNSDKDQDETKQPYIQATDNASHTEKTFAHLGNILVDYESHHYRTQRLLSYQTSRTDIIETLMLQKHHQVTNDKKRFIDVKNIKATSRFKAGIYASYSLNIENNESMNYKDGIQYQLNLLKQYNPHVPIVISEYAAPTTKAGTQYSDKKESSISEKKQAELLIKVEKELAKSHIAGDFILEWQDSWYRSTWNTKEQIYRKHEKYWHNRLSYSQNYGLLSFDTTKDFFPDHQTKEWKEVSSVTKTKNGSIKVAQDEAFLYVFVQSPSLTPTTPIQIDFDITPHSGVKESKAFHQRYERPVDFVADLSQKTGKLYVHDYYDVTKFNQHYKQLRINPNKKYPDDKDKFDIETMKVQNRYYSKIKKRFIKEKYAVTGNLMAGNGNPQADDFNSAADFYRGKGYVELRIPWMMLNFYDPPRSEVIGDLYKNRAIKGEKIENLYVGATVGSTRLKSGQYELSSWKLADYDERKKASYYMLKDYFEKEGA